MTIKELVSILENEQDIVIAPVWRTSAGMYRYKASDIPPTLLSARVIMIYPHSNGKELIIEAER